MSTAREKMLAKFANKPVLENKGFFQRAAERVTENYLNSQGEVEPSLEEQMEAVTAEERGKFFADAGTRIGEAIENVLSYNTNIEKIVNPYYQKDTACHYYTKTKELLSGLESDISEPKRFYDI